MPNMEDLKDGIWMNLNENSEQELWMRAIDLVYGLGQVDFMRTLGHYIDLNWITWNCDQKTH